MEICKVSEIDYAKGLIKVEFPAKDNIVSSWITFPANEYEMPEVGDLVKVEFEPDAYGNPYTSGICYQKCFNKDELPKMQGKDLIIRSPATSGRVGITCQQAGSIGNGYAKGKINIIVDPVAYVAQVGNVEKTQGGADVEDDESLRTRIFYAPKGYSVAGPKDSYEFWVREFSQAVEGVGVTSPSAGKVDICLTLTGGEIPEGSYIERLKEYLEDKRPLTDELTIHAPKVVQFDLDITYYINRSDTNREIETKAAVEAAVQQYLAWQESTIGRDLNPDKLVALVIGAGAKRIEVTKPQKQIISAGEIFKRRSVQIRYGGLEDD